MSSVSSIILSSSYPSIAIYASLEKEIADIVNSLTDLQKLVDVAGMIILELSREPQNTYTIDNGFGKISVKLNAVMSAILVYVDVCGGDRGKRYIASVIVACGERKGKGKVVEALGAVGVTWLTHFLFIFQASRGMHEVLSNQTSELDTPTDQEIESHFGEGVSNRSFKDDLLKRDGYKCHITGFQDSKHPALDTNIPNVQLQATHILPRGVCKVDEAQGLLGSFESVTTTFNLLVNLTGLPAMTLEELCSRIDDPSNIMMLQSDAHDAFEDFTWYLKKTEKDNVYTMKSITRKGLIRLPKDNLVTFIDHSSEFSSLDSTQKSTHPVPLPNSLYIAIHATVAQVLDMSSAGNFFDELLDQYRDGEGNIPLVLSWSEFEKVMSEEAMRESIFEAFHSARVRVY